MDAMFHPPVLGRMPVQSAVRLVVGSQLVFMLFSKSGLSCFPTDFDIFIMDCLVGLAIGNRSLNSGNDFHSVRCSFHFLADCSGFLVHALQGGVQIFQSEKLMFFQIDQSFGDSF